MDRENRPPAPALFVAEKINAAKPWAIPGPAQHPGRNVVYSLRLEPDVLEKHVEHLFEKYDAAAKELVRYKTMGLDEAEIVFVAFGTMSRLCAEAIELLEAQGIKAGLIRPISLWPYPDAAFDEIGPNCKVVISTELNMGQMLTDVKAAAAGRWPVGLINRTGGIVPSSLEIVERAKKLLEGVK